MDLMSVLMARKLSGGGLPAGGSAGDLLIKASSADGDAAWYNLDVVRFAAQTLTDGEKAQARTNIGAGDANKPLVMTDSSSTSVTLALAADNTIYEYGELTALTVTDIPATGDFIIRFTSGATATTTNFPASMVFPEAFAAEANTRYEINVSNGYALAVGWPVVSP